MKQNKLVKNQGESCGLNKKPSHSVMATYFSCVARKIREKRGPQNEGISLLFVENKRDIKLDFPKTAPTPIYITKISTYPCDPNMLLKGNG
jgi:hypothetical protein